MQAKMDAIAPIIGFLVNGAGLTTLYFLLERSELKDLEKELSGAIKSRYGETYDLVDDRRAKLWKELKSPLKLTLHLINIIIFAALILVLIVGPVTLFTKIPIASLAVPLTGTKTILFVAWLVLAGLAYIARAGAPTIRLVRLYLKVRKWMRDNVPPKPGAKKSK